ncbi:hypothetical protein GJAV_G00261790 [Gymnothorax javanicus]|nr:hypothetical protein GJAV_G00261790 [Gymnothorax javanicus]
MCKRTDLDECQQHTDRIQGRPLFPSDQPVIMLTGLVFDKTQCPFQALLPRLGSGSQQGTLNIAEHEAMSPAIRNSSGRCMRSSLKRRCLALSGGKEALRSRSMES